MRNGLNSLLLVAAGMALFNPLLPGDPSFQLSFSATLGLILFVNPFTSAFTRLIAQRLSPIATQYIAGPVGEYVLMTFAAQLAALPVSLYHFGRLSPVSTLANPLILPAVSGSVINRQR